MASPETEFDIEYVANLARIALSEEEKAQFTGQLGEVLGYFERLRAVDVEGIEPSAHAFDLDNVLQADVAVAGLEPGEALRNAPAQRDRQVVVPKVVDDA
ncbi:MAG: Asp-tRNA(Asn)/Glu-tRNA(Gln) amidotransferase subunit GatC [Opitutales bacterium]